VRSNNLEWRRVREGCGREREAQRPVDSDFNRASFLILVYVEIL
jgi:hypothetical protein